MNKAISRILILLILVSSLSFPITSTAEEKNLVAYVPHYRLEQKGILIYKDQDGNWVNGELGKRIDIEQSIDLADFAEQDDIENVFNVVAYPYDLGFMFSTEEFSRPINKFCQTKKDFIKNYYNHSTDNIEVTEKYLTDGIVNLKYNAELTPQVEPLKVSEYSDEDIYILLGQDPNNPNTETKKELEAIRKLQPTSSESLELPVPLETKKGKLNMDILKSKGFAVYGEVKDNDYKNIKGEKVSKDTKGAIPRYLGYDRNGERFTNEEFPPDVYTELEVWEKDWIYEPWNANIQSRKRPQKGDYNYNPEAVSWLNKLDWAGKNGWTGEKLIDYFMIQSPQTDYTQGSFVGWHNFNGSVLYQTFSIQPKKKIEIAEVEAYIVFIPIIVEYWVEAKTDNLAIKDIRNETSEIEYDKQYEMKFDVYNMCLKDAHDVTVDYYLQYPGNLKYMFTDPGHTIEGLNSQTGSLLYGIPEDYKRNTFELVAKLNMNEKHPAKFGDGTIIEENTMEDNEISILIPIKEKESFDLEVTKIDYPEYPAGAFSPVVVHVRNNGSTNIVSDLELNVEGSTSTRDFVFVPAGKTSKVFFGVSTPNVETEFNISAKIDYRGVIQETNEKNNIMSQRARTVKEQEKKCSPDYVTWTEYRSKKKYKSGKKIKTWTHTEKECDTYTDSDGKKHKKCHTYTVIDGYTVRFYAKLVNVNTEVDWVNKDQGFIKSGYGIKVKAKADIVSNYDRPSQIKNIQRAYFYAPSELKPIQMAGSNGRFELPVNPQSPIHAKMYYIPVNTPDGNLKVSVSLQGASSPGGDLNICKDIIIPIKGNMHEDDVTGKR